MDWKGDVTVTARLSATYHFGEDQAFQAEDAQEAQKQALTMLFEDIRDSSPEGIWAWVQHTAEIKIEAF